jgi:hypothetical protein
MIGKAVVSLDDYQTTVFHFRIQAAIDEYLGLQEV